MCDDVPVLRNFIMKALDVFSEQGYIELSRDDEVVFTDKGISVIDSWKTTSNSNTSYTELAIRKFVRDGFIERSKSDDGAKDSITLTNKGRVAVSKLLVDHKEAKTKKLDDWFGSSMAYNPDHHRRVRMTQKI